MAMYKYIVTIMANISSLVTLHFLFSPYLILFTNDPFFLGCGKPPYILITKASRYTFKKKLSHIIVFTNCFVLLYLVV
jgi:hypothetical protein